MKAIARYSLVVLLLVAAALVHGQGARLAAGSDPGIRIYVDGQFIGTADPHPIEYDVSNREIRIYTAEGVFGCQVDRLLDDRFEFDE